MSKVIDHDGQLCIQDDWQIEMSRPVRSALVFPLGAKVRGNEHLVGAEVSGGSGGVYWFRHAGAEQQLRLPDGGQTQCVARLEEPLKAPRGGPWEYSWGEWVNQRTGKRQRAL